MIDWSDVPGVLARFRSRIELDPETGCHNWRGTKSHNGYGRLDVNYLRRKTKVSTHRLAYELAKGPIPAGLQIDHLCRNRACCNPDHLEAVTLQENVARSWTARAGRDRSRHGEPGSRLGEICSKGHAIADTGTYLAAGRPVCRACRNDHKKLYRLRRGSRCGRFSKLTPEQVLEVRRLCAAGVRQAEIAAMFGVTPGNVSSIRLGKTWAHLAEAA